MTWPKFADVIETRVPSSVTGPAGCPPKAEDEAEGAEEEAEEEAARESGVRVIKGLSGAGHLMVSRVICASAPPSSS